MFAHLCDMPTVANFSCPHDATGWGVGNPFMKLCELQLPETEGALYTLVKRRQEGWEVRRERAGLPL